MHITGLTACKSCVFGSVSWFPSQAVFSSFLLIDTKWKPQVLNVLEVNCFFFLQCAWDADKWEKYNPVITPCHLIYLRDCWRDIGRGGGKWKMSFVLLLSLCPFSFPEPAKWASKMSNELCLCTHWCGIALLICAWYNYYIIHYTNDNALTCLILIFHWTLTEPIHRRKPCCPTNSKLLCCLSKWIGSCLKQKIAFGLEGFLEVLMLFLLAGLISRHQQEYCLNSVGGVVVCCVCSSLQEIRPVYSEMC